MGAIQLELKLDDKTDLETKVRHMELQVAAMEESMGKVRRKLFAQMGEIQKLCVALYAENQHLKSIVTGKDSDKVEWIYGQNGCLFSVLGEKIS